jgi:ABC-type nitrate/sulfonate/bicarbonate transport system substrate-binding protein
MSHHRQPKANSSPHPLLMWYARCPTLTALGLIANRGVFQREFLRENVSVVSVRDNATPGVREGHFDHSLPHLIREADAATALWAQSAGARSTLLALGATYHSLSIAVRADAPASGLLDLAGLKLCVPHETGPFSPARARAERNWAGILAFSGISPLQASLTALPADAPNVPFGDVARREIEALQSGRVDAILMYGARGLENIRTHGLKELHHFTAQTIADTPALEPLIEQRALTVDPLLFEEHAEVVARIQARLAEVPGWAQAFPKEALNQAALEARVSVEDAQSAYGDLIARSARLGLETERLERLERLRHWMIARGLISDSPVTLAAWAQVPRALTMAS